MEAEALQVKEQTGKRKGGIWIFGVILSVIAAVILSMMFLSYDGQVIENNVPSFYDTYNMNSLFDYNMVLYKRLLALKDGSIGFQDLLVNGEPITAENVRQAWMECGYLGDADLGEDIYEEYAAMLQADRNAMISRLMSLERNLTTGQHIESLNYYIMDKTTGQYVSNLENPGELYLQQYGYYFILDFDAEGKIGISGIKDREEEQLRTACIRYGSENFFNRYIGIYGESGFVSNAASAFYGNERMGFLLDNAAISQRLQMVQLKDCEIFWGVRKELVRDYSSTLYNSARHYYSRIGLDFAGLFLILLACICGFFASRPFVRHKKEPLYQQYWLLPFELIVGIGVLCGLFANLVVDTATTLYTYYGSSLWQDMNAVHWVSVLFYAMFLIFTAFGFFAVFYCGASLEPLFQKGLKQYWCENTILGIVITGICRRIKKVFWENLQVDISKDIRRNVIFVLVLNALAVSILCMTWVFGVIGVVVYSVVLYFLAKRYLQKIQNDYRKFLHGINNIAEGDLEYRFEENLGIFEPMKPQIYRIEEGFSKAVVEETKSQKLKSELITNVSHDLKTPLTAIITYIDLLEQENITPQDTEKYVGILKEKSNRLKHLIEDLFEVSKANSNNIQLHMQSLDVENLLRQLSVDMEERFAQQNLVLKLRLAEEKHPMMLDAEKTYRIYENLFINVLKYAMEHTRVYVDSVYENGELCVEIKNISASELTMDASELTQRFVRGDLSRNTEGHGLGLAIVQSFTEAMGGRFEIRIEGDLFIARTIWKG